MAGRPRSATALGVALGGATWLGGLLALRAVGAAVIPGASGATVSEAALALAATVVFATLCFEGARRLTAVRPHGAMLYAVAFTSAHLGLDAAFLVAAAWQRPWAPGLSSAQVQSIAAFLPLAYLALLWVPVMRERRHAPR
jgi:hypothetical protein